MHDLIMSPSLYTEWSKCNRKALINSDRFLGNIHTVYGRAYEDGCKTILNNLAEYMAGKGHVYTSVVEEYGESEEYKRDDQAREYIVGLAILQASRYLIKFDVRPHKEKNVFTLALGLQESFAWLEAFLRTHVVEQYEERIIFEGPNFVIGGAYDFMAKLNSTTHSSIYDFKGITSLWNYSFPSSPQIPVYTVLKQMALLATGSDKVMSMNGGYLINMTSAKKEDNPFLYIPINTKLVLANLDNMMSDFIRSAKQLYALQTSSQSALTRYMNADVGLNHCTANFNCYNLSECENQNFVIQVNPDDRQFDKVTKYQFSDSLLKEAIKKIRANSSITNLVDGDGISSGDVFEAEALDDFLGITGAPIDIGEL